VKKQHNTVHVRILIKPLRRRQNEAIFLINQQKNFHLFSQKAKIKKKMPNVEEIESNQ